MKSYTLKRVLADRDKLDKNSFWQLFLENLNKRRDDLKEQLATSTSIEIDKMRRLQGECSAYLHVYKFMVDDVVRNIQKELDSLEEQ